MQILGSGLSYYLLERQAYLLGKLNHDSFIEVPSSNNDTVFSFTIDTQPEFRTYDEIQQNREFRDFVMPIDKVYNAAGVGFPIQEHKEPFFIQPIAGTLLVQKVIYYDNFIPYGYFYFEFEILESQTTPNEIIVSRGIHIDDLLGAPFHS